MNYSKTAVDTAAQRPGSLGAALTGVVVGALVGVLAAAIYSQRVHSDEEYINGVIEGSLERFDAMFATLNAEVQKTVHADWQTLTTAQDEMIAKFQARIEVDSKERLVALEQTVSTQLATQQAVLTKQLTTELEQRDAAIRSLMSARLKVLEEVLSKQVKTGSDEFLTSVEDGQSKLHAELRAQLATDNSELVAELKGNWQDETKRVAERMTVLGSTLSEQQGDFLAQLQKQEQVVAADRGVVLKKLVERHAEFVQAAEKASETSRTALTSVVDALTRYNEEALAATTELNKAHRQELSVVIETANLAGQKRDDQLAAALGEHGKLVQDLHAANSAHERQRQIDRDAAKTTVETAKIMLQDGNVAVAGWQFSNAVNRDPHNWGLVNDYGEAVLEWCAKESGDSALKLNLLNDLERLAASRIVEVSSSDLVRIEAFLGRLVEVRTDVQKLADREAAAALAVRQVALRDEINTMLEQPLVAKPEELVKAQSVLQRLGRELNANGTEDDRLGLLVWLNDRLHLVKRTQGVLTMLADAEVGIAYMDQHKLWADPERGNAHLAHAQSVVSELTVAARSLPPELGVQIQGVAKQFHKRVDDATRARQEAVLKDLEAQYEVFSKHAKEAASRGEVITEANWLMREIVVRSGIFTYPKMSARSRVLVASIDEQRSKATHVQVVNYNAWALGNIKKMYDDNAKQLKVFKNTDENKIENDLVDYLGVVDRSILTPEINRCYDEVFNLFYAELNSEQKVKFSYRMAAAEKMKLSAY